MASPCVFSRREIIPEVRWEDERLVARHGPGPGDFGGGIGQGIEEGKGVEVFLQTRVGEPKLILARALPNDEGGIAEILQEYVTVDGALAKSWVVR